MFWNLHSTALQIANVVKQEPQVKTPGWVVCQFRCHCISNIDFRHICHKSFDIVFHRLTFRGDGIICSRFWKDSFSEFYVLLCYYWHGTLFFVAFCSRVRDVMSVAIRFFVKVIVSKEQTVYYCPSGTPPRSTSEYVLLLITTPQHFCVRVSKTPLAFSLPPHFS